MDNYYKARSHQLTDSKGFKNFDLPGSFHEDRFCDDLKTLISGQNIRLQQYEFNNEGNTEYLQIKTAPVIIVEGLFIYFYTSIKSLLHYKVMVMLPFKDAYDRRLKRDQNERNYKVEEISHRYNNHVEPAYLKFIEPYIPDMDLLVDNQLSLKEGELVLKKRIEYILLNS